MLKTLIFFTIVVSCSALVLPSNRSDEVHDLPGLSDKLNFRQFSGYLQGKDPDNLLHYWFVESQNDPSTDPLVLWTSGVPGSSSLQALFDGNGPFFLQNDGRTLKLNPNSWNLKANVIYLEAPVGVGFSFNTKIPVYPTDTDKAAQDNYAALKNFFKRFPQYLKNDLFIAGTAFGGIDVPVLATLVLNDTFPVKLQGISIGNGNYNDNKSNIGSVFYYYGHGFIDEATFRDFLNVCCGGSFDLTKCKEVSQNCSDAINDAYYHVGSGLPFNVYQRCPDSLKESPVKMRGSTSSQLIRSKSNVPKFPCWNSTSYEVYLNQESVRKALNIDRRVAHWSFSDSDLYYKYIYNDAKPFFEHLVKKIRVLIYNGDFDMIFSFVGNEWFVSDLGLNVIKAKHPYSQDTRTAGYKTTYENLTFAIVMGAGMMVPSDKPETILRIFQAFLKNEDF